MGWVKYSTIGAKAGTDLKDSGGSILGDTAVKNASITLNAAGYLNNIGTTEKLKNALITTKADGTLNFDGTTAVAPSLASLTGTTPVASGGTGASNLNAVQNSRITTAIDGTLKYDNTTAVAPNINSIPDAGNTKTYAGYAGTGLDSSGRAKVGIISGGVAVTVADMKDAKIRAFTGLTSSGILDTTVPTAKGGTGTTTTSDFLNSDLGVSLTEGTLSLTRTGTNSTASVPTTLKNSQVTTKADGTLNYDGTTAVQPNINSLPDAGNTKTYAGYAGTGLDSSGRAKVGIISGGVAVTVADMKDAKIRAFTGLTSSGILDTTVPTAKGGTGTTTTTDFLNSDLGVGLTEGTLSLTRTGTNSTATVPSTLKNATIAIDGTTGVISGIGTADIKVNNAKTTYAETTGTKPPADANRVDVAAGSDGNISVNVNGAGAANIAAYSAAEKVKINRLQAGKIPTSDTVVIENTTDSQVKVDNRLSSTEKTRLNAGNSPDNTKAFDNTGVTLAASGVLSGGGTSVQVNIGSVANSKFDTSGHLASAMTVAHTMTLSTSAADAKIVCGNITIDGANGRIVITD